ncbi:MAG: glycosyltransferase family 4 protein [Flavobacteriales bacterium]|nr:glycosyltransferase family 4 protein [Flavobacteriales bacterium]MEB2341223.1 glycosyltransferase family 1 protein [Flavobacteriia bacterium]
MRIAVNTRLLLPGKLEGIGWFAHETLRRITAAHPEHRFIYFFDRPYDARFVHGPNVTPVVLPPPTRHPILYRIWFNRMLPRALRKHRADIFLSPDGYLSLRTPVPQVAVIHDLNFEHFPDDLPRAYSRYYRSFFPRFAQMAARIVTVSEFSRQDIIRTYGVPGDKIDVVYNGIGEAFGPLPEARRGEARKRHTGGRPYFVSVGSLHPRKNIARLLQAFDRFAEERPEACLVIVGESFWWDERMKASWKGMRHAERVIFTGRLGQEELHQVLADALALAFVSYFEGFGIPVAEAMKCGVPVIAANATSLPEVAGDAAIYCDPFDVGSIADAMARAWDDPALRERLAAAGLARSARFTWERTAEGLWESVGKVAGNLQPGN